MIVASLEWPGEYSTGAASEFEQRRQFLNLDYDEIGGILGGVGVLGENGGNGVADVTHDALGQHRLAIGIERRNAALAKINRRHLGNVGRRPHRVDAGQGKRRARVDRNDAAVGVGGTDHPHVKLMRKIDVAGKLASADNERRVFEPQDRLADPRLFCLSDGHRESRAIKTSPRVREPGGSRPERDRGGIPRSS